ncbi:hypothetical protein BGZ65_003144 [Modicella reniformis]|uniref:pyridoxal kinase n=1 Tax=Modicella reniformis TaxID=1440133 RepID=A0A9P6LSS6_9FUNG|nr:hypothetical protein BGZ65_003144 [Modicella reniformis]
MTSPRVLSIQSHMVSGYCGNKAATFPLQLLGFDVDVMNTVNFSNHTGYPSWTGEKATGDQLTKLYEGLQANGLVEYTHLLTGYIGSAQNLAAVTEIIEDLRSYGDPFFVLDPVMGDDGQLYVQPDVIPLYKELIKYAKAITPNQFEAEILTDKKITNVKSCLEVIDILHDAGVENVVITSVSLLASDVVAAASASVFGSGSSGGSTCTTANGTSLPLPLPLPSPSQDHDQQEKTREDDPSMYCVCSSKSHDRSRVFAIEFPTYDGYFTGTGDLFSALLVARLNEAIAIEEKEKEGSKEEEEQQMKNGGGGHGTSTALAQACIKIVATMKAVVLKTFLEQKRIDRTQASSSSSSPSADVVKRCELRLIQGKNDIEQPDVRGVEAIELGR